MAVAVSVFPAHSKLTLGNRPLQDGRVDTSDRRQSGRHSLLLATSPGCRYGRRRGLPRIHAKKQIRSSLYSLLRPSAHQFAPKSTAIHVSTYLLPRTRRLCE